MLAFLTSRFIDDAGRLMWIMLLVIALAGVERLFPAERRHTARGRLRNIRFVAVFQLGGGILVSVAAYLILPHLWLPDGAVADRSAATTAALVALYLFLTDLIFYWYHRAQHAAAPLWVIHELHHADDQLNATSSLRVYLLERPLQFLAITLPITVCVSRIPALAGIRLTADEAGTVYLASLIWLFVAHANLRLELGRWSWIATGPQLHRLHHSIDPEHHNTNFAQFFPIIDVLFGTYRAPRPGEFPKTGTPEMAADASLMQVLRRPFQYWFKSA
jgi:sterol desaturase/sphingolipid hydroxylase (fatty acid hydroxylase superfamily)